MVFGSLVARWFIGALGGTLIIAATSPLFIRSYLPVVVDPLRGVPTLQPGGHYRWRSEGYATTGIGPFGMPGKTELPAPGDRSLRVALWGDSQAEGVSLPDRWKLFAEAERLAPADRPMTVFPFTMSGEDVSLWLPQMPRVESELSIQAHVILIAELDDLRPALDSPQRPPHPRSVATFDAATLARSLPAFAIHAGRRLLTEADGDTRRRLRFTPGPQRRETGARGQPEIAFDWPAIMARVRAATVLPIVILYAPQVPAVVHGRVVTEPPHANQVQVMKSAAAASDLHLVDLRERLLRSGIGGTFPHGFHNGQIGVGHLNADGYRILAGAMVEALNQRIPAEPWPSND